MLSYFTEDEFQCFCGCGMDVTKELKDAVIAARSIAGIPFIINSGARCDSHNKAIGASKTSSHTKGLAVDIKASSSHTMYLILESLYKAGIDRIGINFDSGFIHADIDEDKSSKVLFGY